jgi:hypothetical protein
MTPGKIESLDPRDLADTLVKLARLEPDDEVARLLIILATRSEKELTGQVPLRDAWQICANRHAAKLIPLMAEAGFGGEVQAGAPVNLMPNPDFSKVTDGKPDGWTDLRTYSGAAAPDVKISASPNGRNGSACLLIESDKVTDSGVSVKVRPAKNTRYRLSGWIRTENVEPVGNGPGALINTHSHMKTGSVKGTSDWTQVSVEFDSGDDEEMTINLLLGGYGGGTGKAYFDDVALAEIPGTKGLDGMMRGVVAYFAKQADPATRQAMAATLEGKSGGFAKMALDKLRQSPDSDQASQRKFKIDPAVHARGKEVYAATCVACHQPNGTGMEVPFLHSTAPIGSPATVHCRFASCFTA